MIIDDYLHWDSNPKWALRLSRILSPPLIPIRLWRRSTRPGIRTQIIRSLSALSLPFGVAGHGTPGEI